MASLVVSVECTNCKEHIYGINCHDSLTDTVLLPEAVGVVVLLALESLHRTLSPWAGSVTVTSLTRQARANYSMSIAPATLARYCRSTPMATSAGLKAKAYLPSLMAIVILSISTNAIYGQLKSS